ncbi:hypothetical protein [Thermoflavimicrobium dichotomicum]|uniref:hypothetical protein n=1 Tax=Thermoflavimicrobium dichotomicum TaxID=46223 RepID=UPI000B834433|nr:hypothetical protein [Thermoflavimicrobium dichotomicum]
MGRGDDTPLNLGAHQNGNGLRTLTTQESTASAVWSVNGDVVVTDFGDIPPLGNIKEDSLTDVFQRWLDHPVAKQYHCYCESAHCTGPNILVTYTYYPLAFSGS